MQNGRGKKKWPSGASYSGIFKDNMRDGKGQYIYPGGRHTYQGYYKKDVKSGKGSEKWPNGQKYSGNYKNNERNGYGVLYERVEG
jgi:hypothetical protein